jgi:hypothetical protein
VIWKRTGAGIFLSLDGGKTYDDGVDSNGNAKFNQLWAMLIYANQIICGGSGVNGKFTVKDESDNDMLILDNRGITMKNGAKLIGGNGVLSMFISESNGDMYGGFSQLGWVSGGGVPQREFIYHSVYVPEDMTIIRAILFVEIMSTHVIIDSKDEGWFSVANIQLSAETDATEIYYQAVWSSEGSILGNSLEGYTSTLVNEFGTWNPTPGPQIQRKSVDVTRYLTPGKKTLFIVHGGADDYNPSNTPEFEGYGFGKVTVVIEGYKGG